VTTTEQIMPTLAEIEAGLRSRCTELQQVRDSEEVQREKVRRIITRTAHQQGTDNAIGESLDDLLIQLGLEPRPLQISATFRVVHRQVLPSPHSIREISPNPWAAYQNLQSSVVETTSEVTTIVEVPRQGHDGCACSIPVTEEKLDGALGIPPDTVERVSIETVRCGMSEYPYSTSRNEPNRCVNVAAAHRKTREEAHDDPLVQSCSIYGHPVERHWHVQHTNGDIEYVRVQETWEQIYPQSHLLAGCYARGTDVVGQPVVPEPEPEVEVAEVRVQECLFTAHRGGGVHAHWDTGHSVTYSDDLHYVSQTSERVPGVWSRDADLVGGVHPTPAVEEDDDEDDIL
jgi:hypothetical protein